MLLKELKQFVYYHNMVINKFKQQDWSFFSLTCSLNFFCFILLLLCSDPCCLEFCGGGVFDVVISLLKKHKQNFAVIFGGLTGKQKILKRESTEKYHSVHSVVSQCLMQLLIWFVSRLCNLLCCWLFFLSALDSWCWIMEDMESLYVAEIDTIILYSIQKFLDNQSLCEIAVGRILPQITQHSGIQQRLANSSLPTIIREIAEKYQTNQLIAEGIANTVANVMELQG